MANLFTGPTMVPPVPLPYGHLRGILTSTFSDEELSHFCYDHFRAVYEQFADGMSKTSKVQRLIEYCERRGAAAHLLMLVQSSATGLPSGPEARPRIPHSVSDFVGRDPEIQAISQMLTTGAAAVIIRGMGGVGKTELAKAVAKQVQTTFPCQIMLQMSHLEPSYSPEQAIRMVLQTLFPAALSSIPDSDLPSLLSLYHGVLQGQRVLILVDDARDDAQVEPLAPPPGCGMIVTTRFSVELPGSVTWELGCLEPGAAEQMVRDICPRLGSDAPELAWRCGRLPLALRVAATFLKRRPCLAVEDYLERLRNPQCCLAALRDPRNPAYDVGRSLGQSYEAVSRERQRHLEALSYLNGDFSPDAAHSIGVDRDALEALRLASLLEYDPAHRHYRMHDLVRLLVQSRKQQRMAFPFKKGASFSFFARSD